MKSFDMTEFGGFSLVHRKYIRALERNVVLLSAELDTYLIDENDHAPDIAGPSEVQIPEDAERGTIVARFTVTDRDAGDHARKKISNMRTKQYMGENELQNWRVFSACDTFKLNTLVDA
ncbi:hypothetical protein OSTOST_18443 [Ostertagia ostertagi]